MSKPKPAKPPALKAVKKLVFHRSPELKQTVIGVGVRVQRELESESRIRARSLDKVLRVIVRTGAR